LPKGGVKPRTEGLIDTVDIYLAKARCDTALLPEERVRRSTFSNVEAGFE
jgi:hypothetical protein